MSTHSKTIPVNGRIIQTIITAKWIRYQIVLKDGTPKTVSVPRNVVESEMP